MKWTATHMLKVSGRAPRRVMLNSGEFYTKEQWDTQVGSWAPTTINGVVNEYDGGGFPMGNGGTISIIKPRGEGAGGATPIRSEVTRITVDARVRRGGKARRLIVSLAPGDVLVMREEGTRKKNARMLPLLEAWAIAGKLAAQRLKAERKAKRKARAA